MKVLMAEELISVREHLSGLLSEARNIDLRFIGQDATLLLQVAAAWLPDVVILDARMRGSMTLAVMEALKKQLPATAVVVSAFFYEPYYREAYIRHGADFFFDKSLEWKELIAFLRKCEAQVLSESEGTPCAASQVGPHNAAVAS